MSYFLLKRLVIILNNFFKNNYNLRGVYIWLKKKSVFIKCNYTIYTIL